ncbi:hypothetical protein AGLY_013357 [Aphis glycines]|uniref:Uncharacterized protein n=1 Tax=Aphis glycines TaxID=307491 RepID=A0A6G0T869_APHGL|nr:hypothetical protein AGLY_013357 [Aphis glycines]
MKHNQFKTFTKSFRCFALGVLRSLLLSLSILLSDDSLSTSSASLTSISSSYISLYSDSEILRSDAVVRRIDCKLKMDFLRLSSKLISYLYRTGESKKRILKLSYTAGKNGRTDYIRSVDKRESHNDVFNIALQIIAYHGLYKQTTKLTIIILYNWNTADFSYALLKMKQYDKKRELIKNHIVLESHNSTARTRHLNDKMYKYELLIETIDFGQHVYGYRSCVDCFNLQIYMCQHASRGLWIPLF